MTSFILGTRGSLLALTQAGQFIDLFENKTGNQCLVKTIKTQGDQIQDKPLWQLDGKNFFTKELDTALLEKEVDLLVHSYKDLGSDRPEGVALASVPKRQYAHDILLIHQDAIEKLQSGELKNVIIGTSSPRRITNITRYLPEFLPGPNKVSIATKNLRGNVNTRIEKLKRGDYHGIILALAGLERLALKEDNIPLMKELITGLNFMVLPLSQFPTAAAQGALGVECLEGREDDNLLQSALGRLHDKQTADAVSEERKRFASYGGGCHLAVGIHYRPFDNFLIHYEYGEHDNQIIEIEELVAPRPNVPTKGEAFIGLPITNQNKNDHFVYDSLITKKALRPALNQKHHLYFASHYTFTNRADIKSANPLSLWTAGRKSLKRLAALGHWVNGCSDSIGEEEVIHLRESRFLQLFLPTIKQEQSWTILGPKDGHTQLGPLVAGYERVMTTDLDAEYPQKLAGCECFFWTSFAQFQIYTERYPEIKNKVHACGLGKTYRAFLQAGFKPIPFLGVAEFKNWYQKRSSNE